MDEKELMRRVTESSFNPAPEADFSGRKVVPGVDGLFVHDSPVDSLLRDEEILALPIRHRFHCRHFDLSKDSDAEDYAKVMDLAANGRVLLCRRDHRWDEETKHMRIYVEWTVEYRDQKDRALGSPFPY